ncbi:hypothetical protein CR513_40218, partial [Mucuna pruriens]
MNGSLLVVTCWMIWKARNSAWKLLRKIHSLHDLILQSFVSLSSQPQHNEVIWFAPLENFLKLNVDGCGITTNLSAELVAIHKGLKLVCDACHKALIYESDSASALSLATHGAPKNHHYALVGNKIEGLFG